MAEKTNAIRILDQKKIAYQDYTYGDGQAISGVEVAEILGRDPAGVFKTLVTVAKSGQYYVFMVPVAEELQLKKAAAAVSEKSLEMLKQKDLFPLTGYVHGGCSPIGMKKQWVTVIDESVLMQETILFSAGKIGHQLEMRLADLQKVITLKIADIVVD